MLEHDAPFAVHDEGLRHAVHAPFHARAPGPVHADGGVGVPEIPEEGLGLFGGVAMVHADDRHAFGGQLHEKGVLDPARPAPARPDVHELDAGRPQRGFRDAFAALEERRQFGDGGGLVDQRRRQSVALIAEEIGGDQEAAEQAGKREEDDQGREPAPEAGLVRLGAVVAHGDPLNRSR